VATEMQKIIDQITVSENGTVLYREASRIVDGDDVLSQTYHRITLTPGQDLSGQPENVAVVALAAWTTEVVAAYATNLAKAQGA
jgi:hypothetical protein